MAIRHALLFLAVILTAAGVAAQDDVPGNDGNRGDLPFGEDYKPANEREQRCQDGDYRTCFEIAENHRFGHGVPPMLWYCPGLYKAACVRKHALACFRLGQLLQGGEGVPPDEQASRSFFAAACEMGFKPACPPKPVTTEVPDGGVDERDFVYPSSITDRRGRYWEAASLCESGNMLACMEENQIVASLPENEIMGKRALRHCSIAYDAGLREGCAKDFVALKTVAATLFGLHSCDRFFLAYDGHPIYRCTPRPGTIRDGDAQDQPVDLYPITRGNYLAPDVENVLVNVYDSNRCNAEGYLYLALASWVGGQWEVTRKFDWAGQEHYRLSPLGNVRLADGRDALFACEYWSYSGEGSGACYLLDLAAPGMKPMHLFASRYSDYCKGRSWESYEVAPEFCMSEDASCPRNEIRDVNGDGNDDVVFRYTRSRGPCVSGNAGTEKAEVTDGEFLLISDGKKFSVRGKPPKQLLNKGRWGKEWGGFWEADKTWDAAQKKTRKR